MLVHSAYSGVIWGETDGDITVAVGRCHNRRLHGLVVYQIQYVQIIF